MVYIYIYMAPTLRFIWSSSRQQARKLRVPLGDLIQSFYNREELFGDHIPPIMNPTFIVKATWVRGPTQKAQ